MKDYGLVSIITPSYNCAQFIGQTIASILAQTYTNWELLITDDCSTDESCEIIENYMKQDSRIKLFRLPINSGAGNARNYSIKQAQGRFIAFCDSDDRWYPEKLTKQLSFMTDHHYALSYTSYMTCNEESETTGIIVCRKKETLESIKRDDKIGFLTVIYDTEIIGKVFMPQLRKRQDWALKLRVLTKCKFAYGIKEPLAIYRIRNLSLSRNKIDLIKYNIAVYRQELGWNWIRAYIFFIFVFTPTYILKKLGQKYINQ